MAAVLAKLHVDADGRITGRAPRSVPPGDYGAPLELPAAATPSDESVTPQDDLDRPVHHARWTDDLSLRREDVYGDDGR